MAQKCLLTSHAQVVIDFDPSSASIDKRVLDLLRGRKFRIIKPISEGVMPLQYKDHSLNGSVIYIRPNEPGRYLATSDDQIISYILRPTDELQANSTEDKALESFISHINISRDCMVRCGHGERAVRVLSSCATCNRCVKQDGPTHFSTITVGLVAALKFSLLLITVILALVSSKLWVYGIFVLSLIISITLEVNPFLIFTVDAVSLYFVLNLDLYELARNRLRICYMLVWHAIVAYLKSYTLSRESASVYAQVLFTLSELVLSVLPRLYMVGARDSQMLIFIELLTSVTSLENLFEPELSCAMMIPLAALLYFCGLIVNKVHKFLRGQSRESNSSRGTPVSSTQVPTEVSLV